MSLHEAVPWFQIAESRFSITGLFDGQVLYLALIGAVAWVLGRGAAAIIGEYFKRLWFTGWRDELRQTKSELAALKVSVEAERRQYEAERALTERLVSENDRLLKRILELQVAIAQKAC